MRTYYSEAGCLAGWLTDVRKGEEKIASAPFSFEEHTHQTKGSAFGRYLTTYSYRLQYGTIVSLCSHQTFETMREHRRRFISFLFFLVLSTYLVITDGFVMIPERRFSTAMLHANMPRSSSFVSSSADDKDVSNRVGNQDDRSIASNFPSRRNILLSSAMLCGALTGLSFQPQPARAELIQFPCEDGTLRNTYHFMRAGQSLLEEENLWGTNPMFLTNRENSISELGVEQVQQACQLLEQADLSLSRVQFPLAANAMDTADIVAHQLQIGRTQLMPEYTYMDQRGIGKWDMLSVGLQSTQDAVWAMDAQEAGKNGLDGGLPPLNDDGTANEMLGHQVTRLRQLLSCKLFG